MALGSCYNCLKYLMFVFNFIFWLVGCSLLAVGIWVKVDAGSFGDMVGNDEVTSSLHIAAIGIIILGSIVMVLGFLGCCGAIRESQCMLATFFVFLFIIILGSIVMVLGFLGCCGAIRESQCMLATFFVFLFIIFSVLLAAGIYVFLVLDRSVAAGKEAFTNKLKEQVRNYNTSDEARERLDELRNKFQCCGAVKGDMIERYGSVNAALYCGQYVYSEGCANKAYEEGEDFVKTYTDAFVGIAFGIAVVMLLGMIFSMMLCCAIRETM